MSKNIGMLIKIILIVLILLFLWLIFREGEEKNLDAILDEIIEDIRIPSPQGDYSRVEDVLILARALNDEIGDNADKNADENGFVNPDLGAAEEQPIDADEIMYRLTDMCKIDADARLTYDDYLKIMAAIGMIDDERFADKYQPEHYFLQSDWMLAAKEMIDIYNHSAGQNSIIAEITLSVLGIGENVYDDEGNPLLENQLLGMGMEAARVPNTSMGTNTSIGANTSLERYDFDSSLFRAYPHQVIKAFIKADRLLVLTDTVNEDIFLRNVFFLGEDDNRVGYFYRDFEIYYQREATMIDRAADILDEAVDYFTVGDIVKESLADLTFQNGRLREMNFKNNVISGKLLAADDTHITIEGQGVYAVAADMQIYRLYDRMKSMTLREMAIGYPFTDFVLEDGEICGALMVRQEAMDYIRVALKTDHFAALYHAQAKLTVDVDYTVTYGSYEARQTLDFAAGEMLALDPESEMLKDGNVIITPQTGTGRITLHSLNRSQGTPVYRGSMEIKKTKDGLVIISEVLLEEYLYSVVPSEMPASYPLEALKAQAICARTYAYRFLQRSGLAALGAHVDDSVGYQVYNNIAENMNTTKAVKETTGLKLFYQNSPAGTYYYSTSSGNATVAAIWKSDRVEDTSYLQAAIIGDDRHLLTDSVNNEAALDPDLLVDEDIFAGFIAGVRESDYEKDEPWYRWEYEVTKIKNEKMGENMKKRYDINKKLVLTLEKGEFISKPIGDIGAVTDIYCAKRLPGGVMDELIIETTKNTYKIIAENTIRYILNDSDYQVKRQDGSKVNSPTILPSAFMIVRPTVKDGLVTGYQLTGGGYGHGVGMSQNGARALGRLGYDCEEILEVFYQGCEIKE